MAGKRFYQAAADEISAGSIDQALWVKVGADMPQAEAVARQAKYIQLRAQELSAETKKNTAAALWRGASWWIKAPAILFVVWVIAIFTIH
jgi:hypothetical protein